MTMNCYSSAIRVLIVAFILSPCAGSHFGGGVISWRPSTNSSKMILDLRLSWEKRQYNCSNVAPNMSNKSDVVRCSGCLSPSYALVFHCADYSFTGSWTSWRSSQEITVTGTHVTTTFASGNWVYGYGLWSLISRADLTFRPELSTINTSPITDMIPIVVLVNSLSQTIKIPGFALTCCRFGCG